MLQNLMTGIYFKTGIESRRIAVQEEQKGLVVPEHIAIILDGNGRWAKMRNMPRNYGHTQGSKNVETICKEADCVCIFNRKLEASERRSGFADEAVEKLFKRLRENQRKK